MAVDCTEKYAVGVNWPLNKVSHKVLLELEK